MSRRDAISLRIALTILMLVMGESFFHTYYAEKQKKAEKYCIHSREEVQCHQLMHIIVLEKRYIDGYHRKYRRR